MFRGWSTPLPDDAVDQRSEREGDQSEHDRDSTASPWAYIRTETGSAAVLLAGTVAALVWVNAAPGSYAKVWATRLSVELGGHGVAMDLRAWVNSGLMTLFFLVVGLEARREFDMGELRDRRRIALPLLAGVSGMVVPVAIFLAINSGRSSAHGWGAAMSTDTAFALGMLALLGSRFPRRLHTFILTVAVVDDFLALAVIAVAYSEHISWTPLLVGIGVLLVTAAVRRAGVRRGGPYAVLGIVAWVAFVHSGVDPVVVGLIIGLLAFAYPAPRDALERASGLFRSFREQPTAELEREARLGIASALSPNDRLQRLWHPWTSYAIVPLFALANAGIQIDGSLLSRAFTSPITLGILIGYGVGKPIGIVGSTALATAASRGRTRPPVGWAAVTGGGTIAGIGFTVSLLIATLAFHGSRLDEAKIGVLSAVVFAMLSTTAVAAVTSLLPDARRARALLGTSPSLVDLAEPVDPERDHVRGPLDAPVTVVEYGDFECPYCGQAESVVRELLADFGDVRYVWRHLPLTDVHPHAQLAAEAAEAAALQGEFWAMRDLLISRQEQLAVKDLLRYADEIGLDVEAFKHALKARKGAARIAQDVESADLSGVSGTPTFFVNGRRHHGAYDIASLSKAVVAARDRAVLVDGNDSGSTRHS
jgi:Na+/H+ antiporter NhaA